MGIEPKPWCKWAGGKAALVPQLLEHIPQSWNPETDPYVEPFAGGGALFFALWPKNAILSDANEWLMRTYAAVRDNVEDVIAWLQGHAETYREEGEAYYYKVRTFPVEERGITIAAADFIFLNKSCFNGLYRVNKAGKFNVPWGKNPKATICDADNLRLCSAALRGVQLQSSDFDDKWYWEPGKHPLFYCDPPFAPVSKTSNFTSYAPGGFTYADQLRLLVCAVEWRRQGAHVILSQAADESLIEQYRRCGFTCTRVRARRAINSKGSKRGPVDEYIID
jgi:DNA adenine methylase